VRLNNVKNQYKAGESTCEEASLFEPKVTLAQLLPPPPSKPEIGIVYATPMKDASKP
jgi:hypothetical protein